MAGGRLLPGLKREKKITGDRECLSRRNGRNVAISYYIKQQVEAKRLNNDDRMEDL